jgi:hypothetical protein
MKVGFLRMRSRNLLTSLPWAITVRTAWAIFLAEELVLCGVGVQLAGRVWVYLQR